MVSSFLSAYSQLSKQHLAAIQQEVDNEMAQQNADRQQASQNSLDQYRQGELAYRQQQDATNNKRIDTQADTAQKRLDSQESRNQQTNWRQAVGNALKDPNATTMRDVLARAAFAMPGYQPTQEDMQSMAGVAGISMNPTASAPAPQPSTDQLSPAVGALMGGGAATSVPPVETAPTQPQAPISWLDQPLPMNAEKLANMKALETQRAAHAALQQQQADKLQRLAGLDQEIQQANLDHIKAVTDLAQKRTQAIGANTQFDQWYKTGMLNARVAANDIARTRNTIYQQAINNTQNRSDRSAAIQQLAGQRSFLTKQYQDMQGEVKTLTNVIEKNDQKARLFSEYIKSAAETGAGDPKEIENARAQFLALSGTLVKQRQQLKQLQTEQENTQGLISQTLGQQVSPSGSYKQPPNFVPQKGGQLLPNGTPSPPSNAAQLKSNEIPTYTPQQARRLPKGTRFRGTDGKVYRVP